MPGDGSTSAPSARAALGIEDRAKSSPEPAGARPRPRAPSLPHGSRATCATDVARSPASVEDRAVGSRDRGSRTIASGGRWRASLLDPARAPGAKGDLRYRRRAERMADHVSRSSLRFSHALALAMIAALAAAVAEAEQRHADRMAAIQRHFGQRSRAAVTPRDLRRRQC
jgi:hypothetical protein